MAFPIVLYAVACIVALPALLMARAVFFYLQDPLRLRKYPAPSFLAAFSSLWLVSITWSQNRSRTLHQHFLRLGDVIRVGPNHIVFNDPAAIKDVYGALASSRGVEKDEIYDRMAGDAHDLVQLRDRGQHSSRRKAIANAFSAKTVVNMEGVIREALLHLVENLDRFIDGSKTKEGELLNLRQWLNFFTLDVIGDTGFGIPMGFLKQLSDATFAEKRSGQLYEVDHMIESLHQGTRYGLTISNFSSILFIRMIRSIVAKVPAFALRLGQVGGAAFEDICVRKLRHRIKSGPPRRASGDFMRFILEDNLRLAKTNRLEDLPQERFNSLVADSMMMMNAGSDTTAAALTSTIWFLQKNPEAMSRLRKEISDTAEVHCTSLLPADRAIFDYKTVKDLPFLRACIDESLRLRPPIAYQLPRLVSQPTKIAGHDIVPGTVVAVAPYSVHRHPSIYRDPDDYRPDRWVDFDADFPNQREDLRKYSIVFSQGSRACIGRHLAIIELQILIPTLLMRYDLSLSECSSRELRVFERFNSNPGPMFVEVRKRAI